MKPRCSWVSDNPLYIDYHDKEWGKPVYDVLALFKMLCLEGQQAGLSWITILKKREHYCKVFAEFNPKKLIAFTEKQCNALQQDPGIIRNRRKIQAIIANAKAYQKHFDSSETFSKALWSFVGDKPIRPLCPGTQVVSSEASQMAHWLKQKGFQFVGDKICYAFMQAVGMINDHDPGCFCS